MFEHFRIRIRHRSRERQMWNIFLALSTGILTLIFPNFLYLIAGGYLLAMGILFITLKYPSILAALPIAAGLIIVILPELIPFTLAIFLGFFGMFLLLIFQFAVMGIITLIFAILIATNPDSVAYLISFFLLMYAVTNLIRLYQDWRNGDEHPEEGPVSIQ